MRIERRVILDAPEEMQLRYLEALGECERVVRTLRWKATQDAVSMGLPMRMIGAATGYSPAQVSRISTGKVRNAR